MPIEAQSQNPDGGSWMNSSDRMRENDPLIATSLAIDRGREDRLSSVPPPSKPDGRISRIRLSSRWFYLVKD